MDLKIEYLPITQIRPYAKNAKVHSQTQIDNVALSIDKYGWRQPIVIDAHNVIVIGHCRFEAAKKLKLESVPCVSAEDLTDKQVRELRILDNKLNESEWDYLKLNDDAMGLDLNTAFRMFMERRSRISLIRWTIREALNAGRSGSLVITG